MPEPLLNNDGIVHLEKKTGVGCCIYQFSLSLFAHYLFVVAWRRPILGPAGCPVRMASPKISSSQRWPFCSFATADVCRSKKAALSHSLFLVFATSLVFSDFFFFFFFPRGKTLIEMRANSKKQIQDLFSMATYTVHIYLIQITQTSKVSQHIQYVRQRKYKLENGVCRAELLNSST